MTDRLYFRQLLSGVDVGYDNALAQQMVNFIYLIGDRETGEAVVVDPAYDIPGIIAAAAEDDMRLVGALATHYHPDHIGGSMMGHTISGVRDLLDAVDVPVHVQADEAEWVRKVVDLGDGELTEHVSGDIVTVGEVSIELIHTPGHTPGSQCFLVQDRLVAGDTLFLQGCGRTDLPGGDPEQLYYSLTQKLAKVPDSATLYPGHLYDPRPSANMGDTRAGNMVFRPESAEQWVAAFGA